MTIRRRAVAALIGVVATTGATDLAHASSGIGAQPAAPRPLRAHELRLDFRDAGGVQRTLRRLGIAVPGGGARCLAATYARSRQPRAFRVPAAAGDAVRALLGGYGEIVWYGATALPDSDGGRPADADDGAILPALAAAAAACGVGV